MNETSSRHQIMNDSLFWAKLAYRASSWFRESGDKALRRYWIDDFIPDCASDTKLGVKVAGTAWVGEGPRAQRQYRFAVSVPQKMLHRRRDSYSIRGLALNEVLQTLQMEICP